MLRHLNLSAVSLRRDRDEPDKFVFGRLCEFDYARYLKSRQTISEGLDSRIRVAPEIEEGREHDQRVDIWSLGHLIHQLVYFPEADRWLNDIPEGVTHLITAMMANDPS